MRLEHGAAETLDDALLVRRLHDELDDHARHALDDHLARCPACTRRLAVLTAHAQLATEALRAAEHAAPAPVQWQGMLEIVRATAASRRRTTRLRIAAGWIIALAAAGALATAPVRAWIAERWAGLRSEEPAVAASAARPETGRASLRFTPAGPELVVTIATTQAAGTLTVRFTDGDAAEVTVTGGGLEALTVGRREVRIDNTAESAASWDIALPHAIAHVDVQVGSKEPVRIRRGEHGRIALDTGLHVRTGGARDE